MEMNNTVKVNSVVQINERYNNEVWIGCLLQVTDVHDWGVMGYVKIPMQGLAYLRVQWKDVDYIGQAVMIHTENEEE